MHSSTYLAAEKLKARKAASCGHCAGHEATANLPGRYC